MGNIAVIGAGVIGLSVAHELAALGHRVRVFAERDADASVSAVAAALWFPHDVQATAAVLESARVTYDRLLQLADTPASGIRMRDGTVLTRRPDPDLSWTSALPRYETVDGAAIPAGATGVRCTLPVAVTDVYLRWLRAAVADRGVGFTVGPVESIEQVERDGTDAVVVAAGLASAPLLGDDQESFPIRGQIVRLANPGLTHWILDDENPAGLTYVVPRDHDVVCGGTDDVGSWDETADPDTEAAILQRVRDLVPALRDQPVLSRAVGLRPGRSSVRLERITGHAAPVIACYGHGGAGFTLSWGDAAVVAGLVGPA